MDFESTARWWVSNKNENLNCVCATVLWALWKLRNGLCFQGKIWRQVEPVLGAGGGGKDTGQMEAFNQGEQEIRDGLLHWVAGAMWGMGTDDWQFQQGSKAAVGLGMFYDNNTGELWWA